MEAGQVKSLYLVLRYKSDTVGGAVVHEIRFSKDGKSVLESTHGQTSARPDRLLFDQTQLPPRDFIRCERIGSMLYLFGGRDYFRGLAVPTVAYVFDPKSSPELVEFHDLPTDITGTSPNIIAAHGRLYHLASTHERSGVPMPFEVYDPSTKSWDPLPPLPQCPFVPYDKAPRWYMGYAVWGSCILVSLAYPGLNWKSLIFVPVLFNVESGTWHQLKVVDPLGHCFPWRDKAVVVGDTAYALGSKMGSIISFSINKSGSEEDGTLVYSLLSPYILKGLRVTRLPYYLPRERSCHLLTPLGDSEFCLVQTIDHPISGNQPIWITTFTIIRIEGTFSEIQTLHSTVEFMSTEYYGLFWPLYGYNPYYEPKEVMLATTKDIRKERIRTQSSSQEVNCDTHNLNVASLTNRKEYGLKKVCGLVACSRRGKSSMLPTLPVECWTEKVDMVDVYCEADCCPEYELGGKHSEIKGEIIDLGDSSVLKSKKARRRLKRKVKCSKKKGTEGSKRDYIISFGPLFIALFAGILLFPEIRDALLSWERDENMKFGLLELLTYIWKTNRS